MTSSSFLPAALLVLACTLGCSLPRGALTPIDRDGSLRDTGLSDVGTPDRDAGPVCVTGGCDDGNACTDDDCVPATGCRHRPNAGRCDDGVLCNGGDTCGGGACSVHDGVDPCPGASSCDAASDACTGCMGPADCPAPMRGDFGACEASSTDVCALVGSRSREVTSYTCLASICEAAVDRESEACPRATDGTSCAADVVGEWASCGDFAGVCGEDGTQSRDLTTSICASGSCTAVSRTETMACTRETDGTSCGAPIEGPYGPCVVGAACSTSGVESRDVETPVCQAGLCASTNTTETRVCTVPSSDGAPCGAMSCDPFGPCMPRTMDACETMGTRSRLCMTPLCASGSCSGGSAALESEDCAVPPGEPCTTRICTICLEAGRTTCRPSHSGFRDCTLTTGTCSGTTCVGDMIGMTTEPCAC